MPFSRVGQDMQILRLPKSSSSASVAVVVKRQIVNVPFPNLLRESRSPLSRLRHLPHDHMRRRIKIPRHLHRQCSAARDPQHQLSKNSRMIVDPLGARSEDTSTCPSIPPPIGSIGYLSCDEDSCSTLHIDDNLRQWVAVINEESSSTGLNFCGICKSANVGLLPFVSVRTRTRRCRPGTRINICDSTSSQFFRYFMQNWRRQIGALMRAALMQIVGRE